jgi:uncharacterized protein
VKPTNQSRGGDRSMPVFRELPQAECVALLRRNHVGRVAFTFHDRVDVEPIHYVYADGWLHGRTALGAKIAILRHHPWVAFEVDEVEDLFDWQSVVVHGVVHVPEPDGSATDRQAYADTLAHVRTLVPQAIDEGDPTPERAVLFRIHVDSISGRAARSR